MTKEQTGLSIEEELLEKINQQLDYGDSRSEWIEEAIRMRLDAEADADGGD